MLQDFIFIEEVILYFITLRQRVNTYELKVLGLLSAKLLYVLFRGYFYVTLLICFIHQFCGV